MIPWAEELETAGRQWAEALEGSAFASVREFEKALLEKEEHDRLKGLAIGIEREETEAKVLLAETRARLARHTEDSPVVQDIKEVDPESRDQDPRDLDATHRERQSLETAQKELNRHQGEIGEKLKADQASRQRHSDLLEQIDRHKARYDLWVCLSGLIGSRDGDKFRPVCPGIDPGSSAQPGQSAAGPAPRPVPALSGKPKSL